MATLVLTVIGDDRSGLVSALSGVIAAHGGSWERSQMARLAGKFAGIVLVAVPDDRADELIRELQPLRADGLLDVTAERSDAPDDLSGATRLALELVGADRPGIVHDISRALATRGVSIEELQTATREALKIMAPLIALPISGAWNAFVSYRILREARMRVLGPSAVEEMIATLLDYGPELSERGKSMLLRAVGVAMVRKRCAHPNLLVLLRTVVKRTGAVRARELDSTKRFLQTLPTLSPEEQRLSLIILQIGFMLDGSLSRTEKTFIIKARRLCGLSSNLLAVEELLKTFIHGAQIYPGMLEALARD